VRFAFAISFLVASLVVSLARADAPFIKISMEIGDGYVVPAEYAAAHKAEVLGSIPGHVQIDGFWTPTQQGVETAERAFRDLIRSAAKDPSVLFPDLADASVNATADALQHQQVELNLVSQNFGAYLRQYVGIIVDGQKLILCNYAHGPTVDPSTEYLSVEKYFVGDGSVQFLQGRVDEHAKTCSNVSFIGSWQGKEKN